MKISILDPGLISLAGHHLDVGRRIAAALKSLGHSVELHACRELAL
jgi:hypothetical protein